MTPGQIVYTDDPVLATNDGRLAGMNWRTADGHPVAAFALSGAARCGIRARSLCWIAPIPAPDRTAVFIGAPPS